MESMELFIVKRCWGNFAFDYVHSDSVGNSGGILYVWDPNSFCKSNTIVLDYFVMIRGVWLKTGVNLLIVAVYAPHDPRDKRMLWEYLVHVINQWNGEVVIMGDFKELRYKFDKFGSIFNAQGADAFNSFIANAGLEEVYLGGIAFTWCHKSATKMSKIDRFLISENLLITCPHISATTLERYLFDHRPILLRETLSDYGPVPFSPGDESNGMRSMMRKLKFLKVKIREWINGNENNMKGLIDRSQLNIRGVMVDGLWTEKPSDIKREFFQHFRCRFDRPKETKAYVDMCYPISLSIEQQEDLKCYVSKEELKRAVWDCGTDKSPGPDGFTFGFYRHFWSTIENDVFEAVNYFLTYGDIPKGCNSSFITLIPKVPNANLAKKFRPISLIGSIYKIIAKILANRIVEVLGDVVNEVQSAFIGERQILDGPFILNEVLQWCKLKKKQSLIFKVDFEKAYDLIRWDFLDDVLKKFGFGNKWCAWIQSCLRSSRGSILINGSPTEEFQFFKCSKQGDLLSLFLFILIMETLHLSFQRVVDAGMFMGTKVGGSMSRVQAWKEVVDKKTSLWAKVIKAIHDEDGKDDNWIGGGVLKDLYPRIYALEACKTVNVSTKLNDSSLDNSFRRRTRGGVKQAQYDALSDLLNAVTLVQMANRWVWSLESSREFLVASIQKVIDEKRLLIVNSMTRWLKYVPIKLNFLAWKVKIDALPTRLNMLSGLTGLDVKPRLVGTIGAKTLFLFLCNSSSLQVFA
uniref:RNA-directed DNA polymerase, eukaryota, reverse transcriptase zinc-binding domain protein n=1 Tax=Tanacetum cinerariifolium TaxID=118510 RepID=A0A6L2KVB2_TANCI|nr:RNA-directed DNA polymerase, eukaryota, reverse transcriptase zinc-binding domain protein [Tanacetum cinerariifolium]